MSQTTASSILCYGVSDSRKTTQIPEFARFVYELTGRRTRMVSCETAGADRIQPAVDAGLVIPYWLRENPRSGIVHLARGDWPHPAQVDGRMVAKWGPCPPSEWDEIGGYAIEGTASIAEMIVRQLIAEGRKVQEEVVSPYTEDDIKLGAAARSHFGVAQQDVLRLLAEAPRGLFDASRGKVQYILFTGHEAKGEDDQKSTIYGVGTTGKAAVKSIPKLVGTLLHHEVDRTGKKVWAYFRPHPDMENGNIVWDAKANLPAHPKVWALAEQKWPGGRFELSFEQSLYHYLKFQEEAKKFVAEQTKQMLASMEQAKLAQVQKTEPPSAPIAEAVQVVTKQ
jgi:hypothetical protein